ncbi:hypothetical protein [Litchfieldella qijiaojingensis]|nr:hypothetical protein [Halomonas qijiaojingensis]
MFLSLTSINKVVVEATLLCLEALVFTADEEAEIATASQPLLDTLSP